MAIINSRQINGIIKTDDPVWENVQKLSEASTAWFTYDVHTGLYSWVVNGVTAISAYLDEGDIIGAIQINGSNLTNLYNAVEIEYPNTEIRDQPHYTKLYLPNGLRNAYEPDNTLQMSQEFINNQPQAQHLAMITLKQSRLDRSVTINMDYTKINLRAGDVVAISSETYGWIDKLYRIMRVREIEGDNGALTLEFQLIEYDATIYDGTWDEFLVAGPSGIRSLGSIGIPGTPAVTITNTDSLPQQTITSTVPAGVVNGMQFWAGNVDVTGNINTTSFDLYNTVSSLNADSFTVGDTATFEIATLRDGDWVWKTRGINDFGTGPFSAVSGNVEYTRVQTPDAIKVGTPFLGLDGQDLQSDTTGGSVGSYAFSSLLIDTIQISGTPNKAIFTTPVYMLKIGNVSANLTVGNVTLKGLNKTLPASKVVIQVDHSATLLDTDRSTIGQGVGQTIWYNTAPWDQNSFNANGFGNLNYTNWKMIGVGLDSGNVLSGNLRHTTLGSAVLDLTNFSGNILSIGVSSTYLPDGWANVTQDANGVITTNVAVSGNTVIFEETTTGTDIYKFPGNSVGRTALNGGNDSVINYRFFF